jgi:hypothetical protein
MTDLLDMCAETPSPSNEWTEHRVSVLVQLRGEGIRRGLIAQKLNELTGANFTKSSVCGKIFRLFPVVKPRKTEEEKLAIKLAARKRDAENKRKRRQAWRELNDPDRKSAARGRIDPAPYQCREVAASPLNVSFADLESGMCRYPYGDDPRSMIFCGHKVADKNFWLCPVHKMLCTRPFVEKVAA